jgi:hypothetical protein
MTLLILAIIVGSALILIGRARAPHDPRRGGP